MTFFVKNGRLEVVYDVKATGESRELLYGAFRFSAKEGHYIVNGLCNRFTAEKDHVETDGNLFFYGRETDLFKNYIYEIPVSVKSILHHRIERTGIPGQRNSEYYILTLDEMMLQNTRRDIAEKSRDTIIERLQKTINELEMFTLTDDDTSRKRFAVAFAPYPPDIKDRAFAHGVYFSYRSSKKMQRNII